MARFDLNAANAAVKAEDEKERNNLNEAVIIAKRFVDRITALQKVKSRSDIEGFLIEQGCGKSPEYYLEDEDINELEGISSFLDSVSELTDVAENIRDFIKIGEARKNELLVLNDENRGKDLQEKLGTLLVTAKEDLCIAERKFAAYNNEGDAFGEGVLAVNDVEIVEQSYENFKAEVLGQVAEQCRGNNLIKALKGCNYLGRVKKMVNNVSKDSNEEDGRLRSDLTSLNKTLNIIERTYDNSRLSPEIIQKLLGGIKGDVEKFPSLEDLNSFMSEGLLDVVAPVEVMIDNAMQAIIKVIEESTEDEAERRKILGWVSDNFVINDRGLAHIPWDTRNLIFVESKALSLPDGFELFNESIFSLEEGMKKLPDVYSKILAALVSVEELVVLYKCLALGNENNFEDVYRFAMLRQSLMSGVEQKSEVKVNRSKCLGPRLFFDRDNVGVEMFKVGVVLPSLNNTKNFWDNPGEYIKVVKDDVSIQILVAATGMNGGTRFVVGSEVERIVCAIYPEIISSVVDRHRVLTIKNVITQNLQAIKMREDVGSKKLELARGYYGDKVNAALVGTKEELSFSSFAEAQALLKSVVRAASLEVIRAEEAQSVAEEKLGKMGTVLGEARTTAETTAETIEGLKRELEAVKAVKAGEAGEAGEAVREKVQGGYNENSERARMANKLKAVFDAIEAAHAEYESAVSANSGMFLAGKRAAAAKNFVDKVMCCVNKNRS